MAQIRILEIKNFRSIRHLTWYPQTGINCLIGPGDSGKSTILDAIDLCIGARRTAQFTDADFFNLDVTTPIEVTATLGDLPERLKTLDGYGLFLRGYDSATGQLEDEPRAGLETVICLRLCVSADLEPYWSLVSDRAAALAIERNLNWADRQEIAPTRIGGYSDHNLSWRRGSVLNKLSDEKADASAILLGAARDARTQFGAVARGQLADALAKVKSVADNLGVGHNLEYRADLDAHSVSVSAGTISLHDEMGIPARSMGIGSTRLLIAGLQKEAAQTTSIVLVDEVEHGLEPHRIIRFLDALGAKDQIPTLQVFMTSHSPVAVRELGAHQLTIVRRNNADHVLKCVGMHPELQGVVRLHPEAFLARSVLICEGPSEIGLIRGINQWGGMHGWKSLHGHGTSLVNGGGSKMMEPALAFASLGYRTALFRDDDERPEAALEQSFRDAGGTIFTWRAGRKLEVEIFQSMPLAAIRTLVEKAVELKDRQIVDDQLKTMSGNMVTLARIEAELGTGSLHEDCRAALGKTSGKKKIAWFKNISAMEEIGASVVGPHMEEGDPEFKGVLHGIMHWCAYA